MLSLSTFANTYTDDECEDESSYMYQTDPVATQLLSKVKSTYKSYKALKADFTLHITNADAQYDEKQAGQLYIKGNKYKIVTPEMERFSDNKSVWTYFKDQKEVQINEFNATGGEMSPIQLLSIYDRDFSAVINGETTVKGIKYTTVDLKPNDTSLPYFKVRLVINRQTNHISEAVIFERNATRYTYKISNMQPNMTLIDGLFVFDKTKYPGVEVVDLR